MGQRRGTKGKRAGTLKTIVFLGCTQSGSSKDATEAAKELGFRTVLLTNRRSFLRQREEFPGVDKMMLTDLNRPEAVREQIERLWQRGSSISAIVSFMDSHVSLAARLSEELGLPSQTRSAIDLVQDKIAFRKLMDGTLYSVPFRILAPDHDGAACGLDFPVVVKSPRSTGSKDVLLANSDAEYRDHVSKLRKRAPGVHLLVESYVAGPQYLAEVLVHDGVPHVVAVIEQTVTLAKRFIVTGYCVDPHVSPAFRDQVQEMVEDIRDRIGMWVGAFHVEFRVSHGTCKIIEVNPRISGAAMNRLILHAFGINLARETLRSLLGERPELQRRFERCVYAQYVTVPQSGILTRITGRKRATRVPFVQEVFVKPRKNEVLSAPQSMGHRYAYVIAAADSVDAARQAAVQAAACIKFVMRPLEAPRPVRQRK
ncbi:ATP-grasp domain-containing protein [Alicyclobacillus macrosporangiidus]|uniref:ATP-grasp domain-containing protein n=1 Tax=Alicyclobacillus macrosporangiidus TaxID=392015 RepID=UPI0026EF9422|nr:ATP-grasp domain-containing protein [Alicyclobacillus macrosporangiidus]